MNIIPLKNYNDIYEEIEQLKTGLIHVSSAYADVLTALEKEKEKRIQLEKLVAIHITDVDGAHQL